MVLITMDTHSRDVVGSLEADGVDSIKRYSILAIVCFCDLLFVMGWSYDVFELYLLLLSVHDDDNLPTL